MMRAPLMSRPKGRHVFVFEGMQMVEDATTNFCVVLYDQQFKRQQIVTISGDFFTSRKCWPIVVSMMGQHLRWWPIIETAMGEITFCFRHVFPTRPIQYSFLFSNLTCTFYSCNLRTSQGKIDKNLIHCYHSH